MEDNSPDRNHLKSRRSCPLPREVYVVIDTAATFAKTNSLVFYPVKRTGVLAVRTIHDGFIPHPLGILSNIKAVLGP